MAALIVAESFSAYPEGALVAFPAGTVLAVAEAFAVDAEGLPSAVTAEFAAMLEAKSLAAADAPATVVAEAAAPVTTPAAPDEAQATTEE